MARECDRRGCAQRAGLAPAARRARGGAVPGSIVPLLLMLAIFAVRFVVGAVGAVAPALAAQPPFIAIVAAALGLASGLFAARAWRILRAAPEAAARAA